MCEGGMALWGGEICQINDHFVAIKLSRQVGIVI
jgi:hypothetical protein